MKKRNGFLILLVTSLLLGCKDQDLAYDNMSDNKILYGKVLEKRSKGMTLALTGESKDRYSETIRVSVKDEVMIKLIEEGQDLSVWYDFLRESDPPQTRALKVAIIKN
ncbi:DUF3221 domain-containing protein [Rossellomorea vietnamensis]|uniref:DUF3221 domain-containing protein n=1 Tax=Rossellomorea vietnamensis TaxID=218284 RepID=UPI001E651CCE|nr:DUF3221 domain-containing protein [Rossellomorea vietnamensis]MCC5803647.1 DUF3221 domain-containing protein [Rossellomorea vietnamensis]